MSDLPKRIWQACLRAENRMLSTRDLLVQVGESEAQCLRAINDLLSKNLLVVVMMEDGEPGYRGVDRATATAKANMHSDEYLVYSAIEAQGNIGAWIRYLKARTGLAAVTINRWIKKLEQNQLIKRVTNVQYPTRKTYMLKGLEPAIELTGGPWYTDNAWDTAYVENNMKAILMHIQDLSFPPPTEECSNMVYPTRMSKSVYPSSAQITRWLRNAKISDTELRQEHVQMLLDALVYSGEIEALPALGTSDAHDEDDLGNASDGMDIEVETPTRVTPSKRKKRKEAIDSLDDEDEQMTNGRNSKRRKTGNVKYEDSDEDQESDGVGSSQARSRPKTESNADEEFDWSFANLPVPSATPLSVSGTGVVYRAIRRNTAIGIGWTQTPCGMCTHFDFCAETEKGGGIDPGMCNYFDEWFDLDETKLIQMDMDF